MKGELTSEFFRIGSSSFTDFLSRVAPDALPSSRPALAGMGDLTPHGTTIVAATFPGGVVVAGDRRATMGNIIAQRDIEKVFAADEFSIIGIAGAAGLAVELVGLFQVELEHYEKIEGAPLSLVGKANRLATMIRLNLGLAMTVSALHGRGSGDLLDAILAAIPEAPAVVSDGERGPRRVAIVGKPNVGKSSLLNKIAGQQRVVVDEVAGTTVDPVDELVEVDGEIFRFIDTAGIRRRVKEASGHEYYASLRTHGAIERSEVCIAVVDASEPVTEQDLRILTSVEEAGRALVIAFNKWDLTDDERRRYLRREIERDLGHFEWASKINISALTGRHVDHLGAAIKEALAGWELRVSTGRLNAFLGRVVAAHPHPVRGGKQPRILFGTQAHAGPPTFVLFSTGQLEPGYVRFLRRRLREEFGFQGTPVHVEVRVREKRKRK